MRYQVITDGLTVRPRFDRRYAVVDTTRTDDQGKPFWVLQTDDVRRATEYADELNRED
jgi:hypothetical protein